MLWTLTYGVCPCYGISLYYGVCPCYGNSQCYGVTPCYGVSPFYGSSARYDISLSHVTCAWVTERLKDTKDKVQLEVVV